MFAPNIFLRFLWKCVAPLGVIAAIALACFFYFYSPGQASYRLTFTAGSAAGMRHQLAQRLQERVAEAGLSLTLRPSLGSEQALDWVNDRGVDIALVQGALTTGNRPNVRQVATLHIEPMHLAVKKELADVSSSLLALRGKTIELGEIGSGTHSLALVILEFVGLQPREHDPVHGYIPIELSREQLSKQQDVSLLPDAVFLVSSLPSPTMRRLVNKEGYHLVALPFAEALALEALDPSALQGQGRAGAGQIVLDRVHPTTIPAYTYGIEPPAPARSLPTLGTRLLLVAHKDVPAKAMFQLVQATYASEFGQIIHPPLEAKLMEAPPEFPWHAGALLYQQRNAPLLSGAVMDSAHKAFAIFAAAASGLFVLWQWARMRGNLTRNQDIKEYITQVTRIEERVLAAERDCPLPLAEFVSLRERLRQMKTQALDNFTASDLAGKELLFGFLLQINDVRDYLTRLIDHRKEIESDWHQS